MVPTSNNQAIANFSVPNSSYYCGIYDIVIVNVVRCGTPSVSLIGGFEVKCGLLTYTPKEVEKEVAQFDVKVYPNPMLDQATIEINGTEDQVLSFQLYDMLGHRLISKTINSNENAQINRQNLPAGMYIYRINDAEGTSIEVGKLKIQ
ncbi:MAG: T9SS type A sorting domain-containing protein [Aureispira sp.]|nr:T9SS type A sorting domain-containing protein [Aureispira sp.]